MYENSYCRWGVFETRRFYFAPRRTSEPSELQSYSCMYNKQLQTSGTSVARGRYKYKRLIHFLSCGDSENI